MDNRQQIVILGNGMATARLLQGLAGAAAGYRITVIGDEPHPAYNRILLSSVLAGERAVADLPLLEQGFCSRHGISTLVGTRAVEIDRDRKLVVTDRHGAIGYDRLVIAIGSRPALPDLPGVDLPGVLAFRTLADVDRMQAVAAQGGRAVVIGGGLLGLEAAVGLAGSGVKVTVLHRGRWLMNRQLDETAGGLLAQALAERGIEIRTDVSTRCVGGDASVEYVELAGGERLPATTVVVAAGITPNVELARACGLTCGRGIQVDDRLTTSDAAISAIGECSEHRGVCHGLVAPVWQQADVLAHNLAHPSAPRRSYTGSVVTTRLKVSGIDVFSAGEFDGEDAEEQVFFDPCNRNYRRLRLRDGRLVGAVMYGDRRDSSWYAELIEQGVCVTSFQDQLMFGRSCCETAVGSATRSAA